MDAPFLSLLRMVVNGPMVLWPARSGQVFAYLMFSRLLG